jgi:hypothetical protein
MKKMEYSIITPSKRRARRKKPAPASQRMKLGIVEFWRKLWGLDEEKILKKPVNRRKKKDSR